MIPAQHSSVYLEIRVPAKSVSLALRCAQYTYNAEHFFEHISGHELENRAIAIHDDDHNLRHGYLQANPRD